MIRRIIMFGLFSIGTLQAHQELDLLSRSAVNNLSISKRCKNLQEDRKNKVFVKNSLDSLVLRNANLQKLVPKKKESLLTQIKRIEHLIKSKITVASRRLKEMDEDLIKKGCPIIYSY